jgi:hypothetical protein
MFNGLTEEEITDTVEAILTQMKTKSGIVMYNKVYKSHA